MVVRTLFIVAFAAVTIVMSQSFGEEEKLVPGVVCFSTGVAKTDAGTSYGYRFRGAGICLSHAKSAALEACYVATNRPKCTATDDECYVTKIKDPRN